MTYGIIATDTIQSSTTGTPPQFNDGSGAQIGTLCRAWVNFNGTSATPITPRANYNVGSVTKNGTGNYTINFTNALPDANYSANITAGGVSVGRQPVVSASVDSSGLTVAPTTTAFRFNVVIISVANTDADYLNVSIFR